MRGKWLFIAVAAVLAGAGGGALSLYWKRPAAAPTRKSGAALIQTSNGITLSGKLRPQHNATVQASVEGNIDAFLVEVGQDVFEGEVLARLGASGLESQRDAAANAVSDAEGKVARAEASVTAARMESSRADADQQRAHSALEKMRAEYERQQTLNQAGATPRLSWEKAQRDYQAVQREFDIMDKARS